MDIVVKGLIHALEVCHDMGSVGHSGDASDTKWITQKTGLASQLEKQNYRKDRNQA